MLLTAFLSLAAGGLTVLAPCVLPLLPVIVGGSLQGQRMRPYLVTASLVVSLLAFTLLLKASTLLIDVDPRVWTTVSGALVIGLGLAMLFPGLWARLSIKLGFGKGSHELLHQAGQKQNGTLSAILTGVALGPVFSSCSPTYAWVIASVLPARPAEAVIYLGLYCLGVAAALLAIALLGRRLVEKLRWAANPKGWFQRIIAVLFICVGLLVISGVDKSFQAWAARYAPGLSAVEEHLLPGQNSKNSSQTNQTKQNSNRQNQSSGQQYFNADYPAAEITGIEKWINSDPLTLAELRGKVVLVDFWTYSCINCIRTQPYLNAWYDRYKEQGLEIIGIHAPEFAFERRLDNVREAVTKAEIKYPVALDNDFATWEAYENRYWPAKYLIDQNGRVRYTHFGEGDYAETEAAIQSLLGQGGPISEVTPTGVAGQGQSPETYLGTDRAEGFAGQPALAKGEQKYQAAPRLPNHQWDLRGAWRVTGMQIEAAQDGAQLRFRFTGKEMYLVMGAEQPQSVRVEVDGAAGTGADVGPDGKVEVSESRLYRLVKLPQAQDGTLVTLTFSKGVKANAFTFGS